MKNNLLKAAIVAAFCFTANSAQSARIESILTHRSDTTCTEAGEPDPNDGVIGGEICDGALGYKIAITYFEHGQSLDLLTPNGRKFGLELFDLGSGTESYIEKEVEWRVKREGDIAKPISMILNRKIYNRAYPDDEPDERLSVFKIRDESVCLIADLKTPDPKRAWEIADKSLERPCLIAGDLKAEVELNEEFNSKRDFISEFAQNDEHGLEFEAEGDLNGDGKDDWAGVVWRKERDVFGGAYASNLYILIRSEVNDKFELSGISQAGYIYNSNCCYVEDLRIENASVYLQVNSKTHGSVTAITYQFRLDASPWLLVGINKFYLEVDEDESIKTEIDLATGDVKVTKKKGESKPEISFENHRFEEFYLPQFNFDPPNLIEDRLVIPKDSKIRRESIFHKIDRSWGGDISDLDSSRFLFEVYWFVPRRWKDT